MTQAEALRILKTGANVFLTGEPGSGKTHTVNAYVAWLREHGIEPAITASTGIAATHIHGLTIHSWSGIGIREYLSESDVDAISEKEHVARRVAKTRVLIIDEISMLGGNVLDMVNQVTRAIHREDRAFGGMQVVLVGDFFQLPPVTRGEAIFAFESAAWRDANPITCYIGEQHRQEDPAFLSILSAIRAGMWDEDHVMQITARTVQDDEVDADVPRLYTHNADVDRINEERLSALPAASKVFSMNSSGGDVMVEGLKRGCLSPETLVLKEGAVVMCTKNQPQFGYVNGTLGVVIDFERGTNHPIIETRDGRRITVPPAEWVVEEGGKIRARIEQVPLRLAWAITVHKSQGMSLDEAAMDLSRAFEYGQGYVALSRVRALSGLYLFGFSDAALQVHPKVQMADRTFRESSKVADELFSDLEESGRREALEAQFIKACGGTLEAGAIKPAKRTTHEETLALLEEGVRIDDLAKKRGLTLGTIADHIEKLVATGRIGIHSVTPLLPKRVRDGLPVIEVVFAKTGVEKLAPAHTKLKGAYTYDELKLARVVFTK